ncbi:IclR family transcriptional regulator [Peribacillus sp. NPDC060186]
MELKTKGQQQLQTVERALRVLSTFNEQKSEYTLQEICNELNLPKTMVFRTLQTLESMGYVLKNDKDKSYSPGFENFRLGKVVEKNFSLSKISLPILQELNDITKETICLIIPDISLLRGIQVLSIPSKHAVKHDPDVSTVGYLHGGAARKTILAHMEPEFINQVIEKVGLLKLTENTITNPDDLCKELKQIKEQGYAISCGEVVEDVFSVAAPIFNYQGKIMGSLTIYLPVYRLNGNDEKEKLIDLVKLYSSKISGFLSYRS